MVDRRSLLAMAAASVVWPGVASAQGSAKRYALVMGNNKYPAQVGPLSNAVNDAKLVANVLRQCGFAIPDDALVIDGDKRTMEARVRAHADVVRTHAA